METKLWWYNCEECQREFLVNQGWPQVKCPECGADIRYRLECSRCHNYSEVEPWVWKEYDLGWKTIICRCCLASGKPDSSEAQAESSSAGGMKSL